MPQKHPIVSPNPARILGFSKQTVLHVVLTNLSEYLSLLPIVLPPHLPDAARMRDSGTSTCTRPTFVRDRSGMGASSIHAQPLVRLWRRFR